MEIKTINKLKELSAKAMEIMPQQLTVNSKGEFHIVGEPVNPMELMSELEQVADLLNDMDNIIQAIKGRGQGGYK